MLEHVKGSGAAIQKKSFDAPDDVRRFPKGIVNLVHVGSVTMGRGILEPGFRWSTSLKQERGRHKVKGLERPIEVFLLAS